MAAGGAASTYFEAVGEALRYSVARPALEGEAVLEPFMRSAHVFVNWATAP